MKIKRYLAPSMRQAMTLVKDELGDDAVIMSTRNTNEGVEVVAAIDPDTRDKDIGADIKANGPRASYESPELTQDNSPVMNQELQKMSAELQEMKSMLQNQLSGLAWNQTETNDPEKIDLIKRLIQLGIGWGLAQELVNDLDYINDQSWAELLIELEHRVPSMDSDIVDVGGVIALVGPTGVGKTTTIAKMASRFVMRNSANQLALITTDCYKIGAQAQLKTFADLLGVPVHVAASQGELYSLLASMSNKKLVLIDTAGMSQKDQQLAQQPVNNQPGADSIKNYLVMSAATQLSVLQDIVRSFGQIGLKGCILTKLDEAVQLGNVLTALIEHNLPVSYLSNGQRVPEDLELAKARDLIDRSIVLGQQKPDNIKEVAFRLGMGKDISDAQ